jgi:hypothetical protein
MPFSPVSAAFSNFLSNGLTVHNGHWFEFDCAAAPAANAVMGKTMPKRWPKP